MPHCEAGTWLALTIGPGRDTGNGIRLQYVGVTPHARGGLAPQGFRMIEPARSPHMRVGAWVFRLSKKLEWLRLPHMCMGAWPEIWIEDLRRRGYPTCAWRFGLNSLKLALMCLAALAGLRAGRIRR